jgi:hypothetical protein
MEVSEAALLKVIGRLARDAGIIRLPDVDKIDQEVRSGIVLIEGIMRSVYGELNEYWDDPQMQETYRGLLAIRAALDEYKKERAIVNARVMHTTPIPPHESEVKVATIAKQPATRRSARQTRKKKRTK